MRTTTFSSVLILLMGLSFDAAAQPAAPAPEAPPVTAPEAPAAAEPTEAPAAPATTTEAAVAAPASATAAPAPVAAPVPPVAATTAPPPPADAAPKKTFPSFKFYGFARLDAAYATRRMFSPQGGMWVLSPDTPGADEAEFVLYPRWSRLGVDVAVAEPAEGVAIDAKVEIDFNNGGPAAGTESRATPRMRHAYGQLKAGDFQILGGQTWDLIAPLIYGGMEQVLFWNGGNLGDRRPQLRVTYGPEFGAAKVVLAAAAAQSGAVDMQDLDADSVMDGVASARPAVQGLAELQIKLDPEAKQPLRVGISGHYGAKRIAVGGSEEMFNVIAGVAHLSIPVSVLTLQAEGFLGENLSDLRGGIGQGIELRDLNGDEVMDEGVTIPAKGGFVQAQVDAVPWYSLQVGAGVDNPKGVNVGGRGLNQTFHFGNAFKPYKQFVVGAVYDYFFTTYSGPMAEGESHRFALYTMVPF